MAICNKLLELNWAQSLAKMQRQYKQLKTSSQCLSKHLIKWEGLELFTIWLEGKQQLRTLGYTLWKMFIAKLSAYHYQMMVSLVRNWKRNWKKGKNKKILSKTIPEWTNQKRKFSENTDNSGNNFKKPRLSNMTNNRTSNQKSNFSKKSYNYKSREDNTGNTSTSTSTTDNRLGSFWIPKKSNKWLDFRTGNTICNVSRDTSWGSSQIFREKLAIDNSRQLGFINNQRGIQAEIFTKKTFLVAKRQSFHMLKNN